MGTAAAVIAASPSYAAPSARRPASCGTRNAERSTGGRRRAAIAPLRQRRFTHPRGAVDRILVEARLDVFAEELDRAQRDVLRLGRGEDAEDDLVAADVDVLLHCLGALVRIADDALPGGNALVELRGRRLGDQLGPLRDAGGAREGVQIPEHQAGVVAAAHA